MPDTFLSRPRLWAWAVVLLWVAFHAAFKLQGLQGLDMDAAEQVYFGQSWQAGYGTRQPPLYTWLALGLKPAALPWWAWLEIARYVLLLACLAAWQLVARGLGAPPREQAVVVLVHLGLALMLWRVHDSLTHTVLATALVSAATAVLLHAPRQTGAWVLAGLLAGLACLAKFNAGLWWACTWLLAGVLAWRRRETPPWRAMVLGGLASAMVVAPYALWWLEQRMGAGALARQITVAADALPWWKPGLDVLSGSVEFLLVGPLLLMVLAAWAQRGGNAHDEADVGGARADTLGMGGRALALHAVLAVGVTAALLTLAQGSSFKARWLWPVIPAASVVAVCWSWRVLQRPSTRPWPRRLGRGVVGLMPVLALALALVRWWEPALNAQRCRECWTDRPAAVWAEHLNARHGPQVRVVTADTHLAGILAAESAGLRTWAAPQSMLPAPVGFAAAAAIPCVAVWASVDEAQPEWPAALATALDGAAGAPQAESVWQTPMRHAPQRSMFLQAVRLDPAVCARATR